MKTSSKAWGYLLAAVAAAAYGTNPAFAVPLYDAEGMNAASVLLFRYLMGLPILAALMAWRGTGFALSRNEWLPVGTLGVLMALSSLGLFESYKWMNSGVASTLLFVYPVMVALLMALFFHERLRLSLGICLAVMGAGLALLMRQEPGMELSVYGCLLVGISALTYALYIIMVNVSARIRAIPTTRLLFYVLLSGSFVFVALFFAGTPLTMPSAPLGWVNLGSLALIPTVISLACTTRAIQLIGSTPTAILGALEPVAAVVLSVIVLHQTLTGREIIGGILILAAAVIVIVGEPIDKALLHVRRMFPRRSQR